MSKYASSTRQVMMSRALVFGAVKENPWRTALTMIAIALGVALGVAVHLVNVSALNEFGLAAHQLAGQADVVVRGPRAGFDETLYPRLARLSGVAAANPAVELDVPLHRRNESLKIIGLDFMRAVEMQPALVPDMAGGARGLLDADAILLSHEAARWLRLAVGDTLDVTVGTRRVSLNVAAILPPGAYRQQLGVMDIASAQWRLERLGRLNRIDLRLKPGTDVAAFRHDLQIILPPGVHAVTPRLEGERDAALTRAYRLNLNMLSLIALFTGAFLVFSTQVLTLLRRRPQLALLRVLGVTRRELTLRLLAEGTLIGAAGSALGVLLGHAVAEYFLTRVGADLGAGYFRAISAEPTLQPDVMLGYFTLGVAFASLGAAVPAWEAGSRAPARALRAGDEDDAMRALRMPWYGLAAIASGLLLIPAPSIDGVPVAGYLAIALLLLGTVLVLPWFTASCLQRLPLPRNVLLATAIAQLKAIPRQAAISVAAIVISLSLMASMLIMVHSFRVSLDVWLAHMLPADLYLRAARSGETGYLAPDEQARIAAAPGIGKAAFVRSQTLLLDPARPPVTLIARSVDTAHADRTLPLQSPSHPVRAGDPPPVWPSEVAADLYALRPGMTVELPIGGALRPYTVAGIWRDYARQNGALVIDRDLYIGLTGDRLASEAAVWLEKGTSPTAAQRALRAALGPDSRLEIAATGELRAASLAVFDRTFAITYALELAAVMIGMFGIGVSFSAQALARRREFGVLRHLGMTRRQVGGMLAAEGAVVAAFGSVCGLAAGSGVGAILIYVVNRQSFHWSMDLVMPWLPLAGLAALIVATAGFTAAWSGRGAMRMDAVMAVREDW